MLDCYDLVGNQGNRLFPKFRTVMRIWFVNSG